MLTLNQDKFFFFYDDCSCVKFLPGSIEHAYLAVLNDDLETAENIFKKLDSPRAKWGRVLVCILRGFLKELPTYFEIRNFLEIDLDLFLKNEKLEYVEQILGSLEILSAINQEVYKYAARVIYINKLYSASLKYLEKSKKIYYNDAELHFLLARYYLRVNDCEEALFYINECMRLIPDYYPAIVLKEKIEEQWI